jgi:acetyltransferase
MVYEKLFNPVSIAVIGASRDPSKIGSIILKNLRITYRGKIFPINKNADELQGVKAYKSVSMIKEPLDLAVIAVPANEVLNVLKECEKKRVAFANIISAGFKESDAAGIKLEAAIKTFLKSAKIKVIGPNSIGVINTNPSYNTSFIDPNLKPFEGKTALVSQSGSILSVIVDDATLGKIGFSKIICTGNEVNLNSSEVLKVLSEDAKTGTIVLYMETLENGEEFIDNAIEASKRKPVIILRGGKSKISLATTESIISSLIDENLGYRLAFKRAGVIPVKGIEEILSLMRDASDIRIKNDEIFVITNAESAGSLMIDALNAVGIKAAKLNNNIANELEKALPKECKIQNPLDLLGDATPERYKEALEIVSKLNKPIVVIVSPQKTFMPIETAKEISEIRLQNHDLPIFPLFLGGLRVEKAKRFLREHGLPDYSYPHEAAHIIKKLYEYSTFMPPTFNAYTKTKIKVNNLKLKENEFGLAAKEIIDRLGIRTVHGVAFRTESELQKAIKIIGYPCVLKLALRNTAHRGRLGGVITGIKTYEDLKKAMNSINTKAANEHLKVSCYELYMDAEKEKKSKLELLIGAHRDARFGAIMAVGLRAGRTDALYDTTFLLGPISDKDIADFKTSKIGRLIYKIAKARTFEEIIDYLLRISKFMDLNKEIKDIEINPVFISEDGAVAADFKLFK